MFDIECVECGDVIGVSDIQLPKEASIMCSDCAGDEEDDKATGTQEAP